MIDATPRTSDLGTRVLSAAVMIALAGAALWLGGWVWAAFVALVALGVLWEWTGLVRKFASKPGKRWFWIVAGVCYIGVSAVTLVVLRSGGDGIKTALAVVAIVVAVDVSAYFAGRTFGGPKIAPRISPSKTWAGLVGGALGAALLFSMFWYVGVFEWTAGNVLFALTGGTAFAVVAQSGDFFESWMKRRAGVKDSGNLLPGHGGLFDRVDGLLAVCFALGLTATVVSVATFASGGALLPNPA